jgi:uncharacterized protein
MTVEWDAVKAAVNKEKHGIVFERIADFDFDTAPVTIDDRFSYFETREVALGFIGVSLHVAVYTVRGETLRLISLRKATNLEKRRYVES